MIGVVIKEFAGCKWRAAETNPRPATGNPRKRTRRDSNSREPFDPTRFPGVRLKPLGHPSKVVQLNDLPHFQKRLENRGVHVSVHVHLASRSSPPPSTTASMVASSTCV